MFVGRARELAALNAEYDRSEPSLVVVFGRRRIGKSRLLQEAALGRPSVYFQATRVEPSANLAQFQEEIAQALGVDPRLDGIADWLGTLRFLARHAANSAAGLVITLDEFPYLTDADKSLPSVFQKFWDSGAARPGALKLVLCGSAIAQMRQLLIESNPLFGRKTLGLDVGPLPLRDAAEFFPNWTDQDKITAYAIFGGVPQYLQACDPNISLGENILRLLLSPTGLLVEEPVNILQSEVGQVRRYASILAAIAQGLNKGSEIVERVPEAKATSGISPYLEKLMELRLVRRENSMDATPRERDSRYTIVDPLTAFWFRFVQPNASPIEQDHGVHVLSRRVRPLLSEFMGAAFEEICREHARRHLHELTGVPAREIGQIWGHADFDLDVAGSDLADTPVFGECKWTNSSIDRAILERLRERAERTRYGRRDAGRHLLLYSRSGFTTDVAAEASNDPNLHLVALGDLLRPSPPRPRDIPLIGGESETSFPKP